VHGNGFFLFDGWKLPAGILVWHLIYGYFLGALYQPKDDRSRTSSDSRARSLRRPGRCSVWAPFLDVTAPTIAGTT